MKKIKCDNCKKQLKPDMEIEFSRWIGEYFCGHDCAVDRYFNYMESLPLDEEEKHEFFKKGGKL